MALIKPIDYKGFTPYWWVVKEVRENRLTNQSDVILCLYADSETAAKDNSKTEYIPGIFQSAVLDGTGLSDEQIVTQVLEKNSDFFYDAVDTDGSYQEIDNQSSIYVQISNDPVTNQVRYAECIKHTYFWRNNIIVIKVRIHFEVNGVVDSSLDKDIVWVVDDYYKIPNTEIGEATYFNSLRLGGQTDEQVITTGILYGDSSGYVNKKLYGTI